MTNVNILEKKLPPSTQVNTVLHFSPPGGNHRLYPRKGTYPELRVDDHAVNVKVYCL